MADADAQLKKVQLMQKILALAQARGLRPEQVMVLMEDPEILAQILEPPKESTPQFASSHFVAQQNQTETPEERAKREKEWADKKRAERQKEISDMRTAGILGE